MKYFFPGFIYVCLIGSLFSCSKSNPASVNPVVPNPPVDSTKQSDTTTDVYIAGYFDNHAGYWKNSQFVTLGPPDPKSYVQDIAFVGNDIFALGQSGDSLGYWKNGQFNLVSVNDSLIAVAMAISGTDVSTLYQNIYSGLWPGSLYKNNLFTATILTETEPGTVNMVAQGSDIFIPGTTETVPSHPGYWKNGQFTSMGANPSTAAAYGIAVIGSDVYAAGHTLDMTGNYWIATFWKDGIPTYLSDSSSCVTAHFIQSSGNDIYIVGSVIPGTLYQSDTAISTILWKNGQPTVLTKDGDQDTPLGLAVDGTDVYVSVSSRLSNGNHVLRYYKNGMPIMVTPALKGGGQRIFIKRR